MIELVPYTDDRSEEWNQFCHESKNGTFMFDRDYMEYHSDRFEDGSLMAYRKNELVALFPASRSDGQLSTHGGLTFGGFLTDEKMKASKMLELFDALETYATENGIESVLYKCIPYIYHTIPASEDRYALYREGAQLVGREVTSAVEIARHPSFQGNRQRGIDDAKEAGLEVKLSNDFESYWDILEVNLAEKHGTEPVHTLEEIQLLHQRFPENLKLFSSHKDGQLLAGAVVYESANVARAQYIANSDEGRSVGALDVVFDHLINEYYDDKRYFDFGVSTEDRGDYLNEGLIFFKEGFGARSVVHDFYRIDID